MAHVSVPTFERVDVPTFAAGEGLVKAEINDINESFSKIQVREGELQEWYAKCQKELVEW